MQPAAPCTPVLVVRLLGCAVKSFCRLMLFVAECCVAYKMSEQEQHTGLSPDISDMDIMTEADEDQLLEWDHSADIGRIEANNDVLSNSSTPRDMNLPDAVELCEYIVDEFVPKANRKTARRLIKIYKEGKGAFCIIHSIEINLPSCDLCLFRLFLELLLFSLSHVEHRCRRTE